MPTVSFTAENSCSESRITLGFHVYFHWSGTVLHSQFDIQDPDICEGNKPIILWRNPQFFKQICSFGLLMLPWGWIRLCIFGGNTTEVMLCSSCCSLSGGAGFQIWYFLLLVMTSLIILSGCVRQANPLVSYSFPLVIKYFCGELLQNYVNTLFFIKHLIYSFINLYQYES